MDPQAGRVAKKSEQGNSKWVTRGGGCGMPAFSTLTPLLLLLLLEAATSEQSVFVSRGTSQIPDATGADMTAASCSLVSVPGDR